VLICFLQRLVCHGKYGVNFEISSAKVPEMRKCQSQPGIGERRIKFNGSLV